MSFIQEFKKFAVRGNVLDMAVGVIIGGAFGKIVTSMVNDIIMPVIGIITGKIDVSSLKFTIPSSVAGAEPVIVKYGQFLQNIINFLIICVCVFFMVKVINKLMKKEEAVKPAPKPTPEEILLKEIKSELQGISFFTISNSFAAFEKLFSILSQFIFQSDDEINFSEFTKVPFPFTEYSNPSALSSSYAAITEFLLTSNI